MARQVSQSSVASTHTNSNLNWWDIHANPTSSWNSWQHQKLMDTNPPHSVTIDGGSDSFPNVPNNSGAGDPTASLLWNHVLLNGGDVHKHQGDENFNLLETLSSKNLAPDMFEPACDYLKKLDESWELAAPPVPFPTTTTTATNLTDLVSNWSIAPPQPGFDYHHLHGSATTTSDLFGEHIELQNSSSPYSSCSYSGQNVDSVASENAGMLSLTYGDDIHHIGDRYSAASDASRSNTRNFTDLINFGGLMRNTTTKQLVTVDQLNSPSTHTITKQGKEIGEGNVKGKMKKNKKKRSDKSSDGVLKKCKHETMASSNLSSAKIQIPKVKLGEKITALQQIVSPFGKTDTASVLMEAINYIKFLHEQVQLLSQDPFMKPGSAKNVEIKLGLGNRGLCLVPISSTLQIHRENDKLNGPDCWTPNYRGFLYR